MIPKSFKHGLRRYLEPFGISIYRTRYFPFGCDLCTDLKRLLAPKDRYVAFDVGANEGQTGGKLLRQFPQAQVYCFEPFPETYKRLARLSRRYARVKTFQMACGAKEGVLRVPVRPEAGSELNSLLPASHAVFDTSSARHVDIKVISIDDFCEQEGIERIDLLKTDTEGFDIEVLKGAAKMLESGKVDFVYAECEFGRVSAEVHTNFFELHDFLIQRNFRLVTVYTDGASVRGFHWGSALFSRQPGPA